MPVNTEAERYSMKCDSFGITGSRQLESVRVLQTNSSRGRKRLYFDNRITETGLMASKEQQVAVGFGDCLVPIRLQSII